MIICLYYKQDDLNLDDVAERLNVSRNHVMYEKQKGFNNLVSLLKNIDVNKVGFDGKNRRK